jgi:hypothetical protein
MQDVKSSVQVGMCGETTMQAIEPMPLTASQTATVGASLRSEGRVDQQQGDAQHLRFVANALKEQTMWELGQPAVKGFAANFALLELKVFQSQNSIRSSPYNEAFGDCLAVGLGEVSLAERQPFQQSAHTPCVLVLCLTLRQLSLQPCHLLAMLLPPNSQLQPVFKENFTRLFNGNNQVRLVAVNANQDRTLNNGLRKGHAQVTNQLPVAFLDRQAVKGDGVEEVAEEVVRDGERQAFPSANSPDTESAVFFNACVPLPFADEEDSEGLFERDSARKFFAFSFGVAGSDETDGSASHLGADDAFNLVVGMFLKGASGKGFTSIPADGRQRVADLLKGVQGCPKVLVVLNQDWDSALGCFAHCLVPLSIITQQKGDVAGRIPLSAGADSTLRPFSVDEATATIYSQQGPIEINLKDAGALEEVERIVGQEILDLAEQAAESASPYGEWKQI